MVYGNWQSGILYAAAWNKSLFVFISFQSKTTKGEHLLMLGQDNLKIKAGQYYLRARYNNAVYGHFMQEDAYQEYGQNPYAYCDSNPVVYYDPSGYNAAGCGNAATSDPDYQTINTQTEQTTQGNVEGGTDTVAYHSIGGENGANKILQPQMVAPIGD